MTTRVQVRRAKLPHYTLLGPAYWWEVHVGWLEPVAEFAYWQDAVKFAHAYAPIIQVYANLVREP